MFPAIVLALVLGRLAPGSAQPEIRVEGVTPVDTAVRGVTTTFYAEVEGRRFFFKRDGELWLGRGENRWRFMRSGNFEAEIVASQVMRSLGLAAPRCRAVRIAGMEGVYLQFEHLQDVVPQGELRAAHELSNLEHRRIDRASMARLALADVVLGNGDRHMRNLWFRVPADGGPIQPIPIDHNLALATERVIPETHAQRHLVPTLEGLALDPSVTSDTEVHRASQAGRPEPLLRQNDFYDGLLERAAGDRAVAEEMVRAADEIRERLTDDLLRRIVERVPDEAITGGDAAARRAEILELVKRRRDLLPAWMRSFVAEVLPHPPLAGRVRAEATARVAPRELPGGSGDPFGMGEAEPGRTAREGGSAPGAGSEGPGSGPRVGEPGTILTRAEIEGLASELATRARELAASGRVAEAQGLSRLARELTSAPTQGTAGAVAEVRVRLDTLVERLGLEAGVRETVRGEALRIAEARRIRTGTPGVGAPPAVRPRIRLP